MMTSLDDLLRNLSHSGGPYERQTLSDLMEEAGRVREAELLRGDGRLCLRHLGPRWWIEERPRPLLEFRGLVEVSRQDRRVRQSCVEKRRVGQRQWEVLSTTPSQRLRRHSQEFSWGYMGSGPAQLALALLLEVAGRDLAGSLYQRFKFKRMKWHADENWHLTEEEVWLWLDDQAATAEHPLDVAHDQIEMD